MAGPDRCFRRLSSVGGVSNPALTGLATNLPFSSGPGALRFIIPSGLLTNSGALVIGSLVLVVAEAFRQGLKLKTENDLTV